MTTAAQRHRVIAEEISQVWRTHGDGSLEFDVAAGRAFIDGIYGGNLRAWQARRRKDASFAKIAEMLKHRVSRTRLYRAVSTYVLLIEREAIPTATACGVSTSQHLCASSFHAVAGLPTEVAWAILDQASEKQLSVQAVRKLAALARKSRRGGRPPKSAPVKALSRLAQAELEVLRHLVPEDISDDEAREQITVLPARLRAAAEWLEQLATKLAL